LISGTDVLSVQSHLFERPGLVGLTQAEKIIAPAEERALIACIDQVELSPFRFQGWLGKRLTASYGWRYDFDTGIFGPTDPIPDWLLPLRGKAAEFAGLTPAELVQVLVIRYDPGAGIGWHRDKAVFGHVIGISLGAPTTLRFRRRKPGGFDRASAVLAPRSAYHLTGPARNEWEHSIAELAETRWSVTFRSLAQKARAGS
jgi:DNA oxidative demethylase